MGSLLDKIKLDMYKNGYGQQNKSRAWLFEKFQNLKVSRNMLLKDQNRSRPHALIGRLYFFFYDPKTKDKLPYYDRFPLVLPIEMYPDGFLGLNLHYLDPGMRLMLLDTLSTYKNNKKYDSTTYLKISYDIISNASRMQLAQPCIKRYLFNHIESRFLEIEASEWDMACLLNVDSFAKAKNVRVWKESRSKF